MPHDHGPTAQGCFRAFYSRTVVPSMNSLGVHRKQSIRHIIDSPKIERWVVENLVQPHPPKMVPLPLGFFPPNCQDDRVGTDATYDAAADLGPSGVCANLWPTIRGYRRELLDRPLNMACSGHVRDSSDYKDRSTLASHCAETGAWNQFAVTPVGEVWLGPVGIGTRSARCVHHRQRHATRCVLHRPRYSPLIYRWTSINSSPS